MRSARLLVLASTIALLAFSASSTTALAASPPLIKALRATHVTEKSALLSASIKPRGAETKYELWIDPCVPPMECITHVAMAQGTIPATAGKVTVSAATAVVFDELGLKPDATYEYGVVAESSEGRVEAQKTFTTR
jgi:hypothetical protein